MKSSEYFDFILKSLNKQILFNIDNKKLLNSIYLHVIDSYNENIDSKTKDKIFKYSLLVQFLNNSDLTYDDIYSKVGAYEADVALALSEKELPKKIEFLLALDYETQMVELASRIIFIKYFPKDEKYLKECKIILSCFKNCNIELSNKLKDFISS